MNEVGLPVFIADSAGWNLLPGTHFEGGKIWVITWHSLIFGAAGVKAMATVTTFVGTYTCPACERFMKNKGELERRTIT